MQSKGLSRVFSPATQFKGINSLVLSFLYDPVLMPIHDYWRNRSFDETDFCWQSDVSAFNMLFRFAIAFLSRSKCLLIPRLQSPCTVALEPRKIKPVILFFFLRVYTFTQVHKSISVSADLSHAPKMFCPWCNPKVTTIMYLYKVCDF